MKNALSLNHFWTYFKKHSPVIFIGLMFLVISQIAVTSQPIFLRNIINELALHKPFSFIFIILFYFFLAKFIAIVAEFLRDYFLSPVIMGIPKEFEKDVFEHLLALPVSYHANNKTGAAARSITRGSQAISFMLDFSVSSIIPPILQLFLVTFLLLKLYNWQYGIITFLTIVIYAIFTIWSTEKRNVFRGIGNEQDDHAGGILVDSINNIETVKYFNNQKLQLNKFLEFKNNWFLVMVKNNRLFALIYSIQGLILLVGLGFILYFAIKQTSEGVINVGDLVLLSTYIIQLSIPITTLGFVYGRFKNSIADLAAMDKILQEEITVKENLNTEKIKHPKGKIEFANVSFSYKDRKIINNLSLTVNPGQKIAFVGPSGAGKSTIAKLLFRLYDVDSGSIKIDDIDVKNISNKDKSNILAIVPQDPALFNDTIASNIRFGKMTTNLDEIKKVAKIAQLDRFIDSLPEKYDTLVGERGVKISGGERQRVAIARAILRNPKILVFDEATSSLDSKNEQVVLKTIDSVVKNRTSVSIAHRLSTIVKSDVIFVLKNGKIAESGSHKELLAKKGLYYKLWQIQIHTKK